MKNAEKNQTLCTQTHQEEGVEIEIFRAIAQEYFYEDSDEEVEEILWAKQARLHETLLQQLIQDFGQENIWNSQVAHYVEVEYDSGYESGPEPMDIDEGESTQGLELEENYTTNPDLDQGWEENNNDSFPEFPEMDLDSEEWSQSIDEYIDWEYYDSL
ncbi:12147_t:CDS:2 [Dentiscutata erythropus]|uniref:12147_t:CDS:1 n=1 Tax=Dentiscutata erythropus TaxID=1348616 RepID=A0A9N9ITV5_9GLOM|nr:12147_t:CDS:2 [Dentiscutata erythropus]